MWAFYRGLKFQAVLGLILYGISLSYSYLVAGIGEHGLLENWNQMVLLAAIQAGALPQIPPEEHYKSAVLITLLMFYFGLQDRSWLANQLLQFDFIALGSQKGSNKEDALKVAVAKLDGALEASSEKLSDISKKTDKFKKSKAPSYRLNWKIGALYIVMRFWQHFSIFISHSTLDINAGLMPDD